MGRIEEGKVCLRLLSALPLSFTSLVRQETRAAEIDAARRLEYTMRPTVAKNTEKILRESGRLEQHDGMTVRALTHPLLISGRWRSDC
jgi:hypothetical protein